MSILIKGVDMPPSCRYCAFRHMSISQNAFCTAANETIDYMAERTKRLDNCPLVEVPTPHGRLIDADAMADAFRGHIALYDSCPFSQLSFTDKARRDELQSSLAEVINAPTIIEAEEGEGE